MQNHGRAIFLASVVLTAAIHAIPALGAIAWPLVLLSTLAHELGHGLTAAALGGDFESLRMWADGSGVAGSRVASGVQHAAVAAGGLVGPALASALCLVLGSRPRGARACLAGIGVGLLVVTVFLVRNGFGLAFVGGTGAVALVVALWAPVGVVQGTLVFASVQLGLSVFSRADYLFTPVARTAGGDMPSDVAAIADALFLPYWFWGALCALVSVIALLGGMTAFLHATRAGSAKGAPDGDGPIPKRAA